MCVFHAFLHWSFILFSLPVILWWCRNALEMCFLHKMKENKSFISHEMMRYSLENAEMALSDAVFIYITEYTWQPPVGEKKNQKAKMSTVSRASDSLKPRQLFKITAQSAVTFWIQRCFLLPLILGSFLLCNFGNTLTRGWFQFLFLLTWYLNVVENSWESWQSLCLESSSFPAPAFLSFPCHTYWSDCGWTSLTIYLVSGREAHTSGRTPLAFVPVHRFQPVSAPSPIVYCYYRCASSHAVFYLQSSDTFMLKWSLAVCFPAVQDC